MPTQEEGAKKILVADGDGCLRAAVERLLTLQGYQVATASDGEAALRTATTSELDLLVVDLVMPVIDGLSVCRHLRSHGSSVPVIVVSGRAYADDCVACLDGGADDYLTKPFEVDELLARIRALLRRSNGLTNPQLVFDDLVLNTDRRLVTRAGQQIDLTLTEYSILELLMRNAEVVLERATFYERIWGFDLHESSKSLDVHVGSLRRKLELFGRRVIHNVRGVGYVMRPEVMRPEVMRPEHASTGHARRSLDNP
jgi:two-component system response regulator MprA